MARQGKALLGLVCGVILLAGCAGHKSQIIGSERVIERSGDSPQWVLRIPKEDNEYYYFRGFKTGAVSLEDGLTDARSNAIRQVLEMIESQGLVDYKKARVERGLAESKEDIGTVISDGLKILSETVASGVKELESYTEKVERVTPEGVRYSYNIYTLVRYPKQEFEKALALAAKQKREGLRNRSMSEADQVIKSLDQGLPTAETSPEN